MRYECIVSALIANNYPALLTGPVGTGKTSTAQSVLNGLDRDKYLILQINMSAQVSPESHAKNIFIIRAY